MPTFYELTNDLKASAKSKWDEIAYLGVHSLTSAEGEPIKATFWVPVEDYLPCGDSYCFRLLSSKIKFIMNGFDDIFHINFSEVDELIESDEALACHRLIYNAYLKATYIEFGDGTKETFQMEIA